jgi:hypothetical protein
LSLHSPRRWDHPSLPKTHLAVLEYGPPNGGNVVPTDNKTYREYAKCCLWKNQGELTMKGEKITNTPMDRKGGGVAEGKPRPAKPQPPPPPYQRGGMA